MAEETRTTPISKDDTSRLVRTLGTVHRRMLAISELAIYARHVEGAEWARRWTMACAQLIEADRLIQSVIDTWLGHYEPWGVAGPHPTAAGVQLGVERMRAGVATVQQRLDRGYRLHPDVVADLDGAVEALRQAYRLMLPAYRAFGGKPRTREEWTAVEEPPGWHTLPAGTSADLTRSAMSRIRSG